MWGAHAGREACSAVAVRAAAGHLLASRTAAKAPAARAAPSWRSPAFSTSAAPSASARWKGASSAAQPILDTTLELDGSMRGEMQQTPGPVPRLKHGLERVLFNRGVQVLKDPRTGVYNFNPQIEAICQPEAFRADQLPPYRRTSEDKRLTGVAHAMPAVRFVSSSSSIMGALAKMALQVVRRSTVLLPQLSSSMGGRTMKLTRHHTQPVLHRLVRRGNQIAIDSGREDAAMLVGNDLIPPSPARAKILMELGHIMEASLTMPLDAFRAAYEKTYTPRPALVSTSSLHQPSMAATAPVGENCFRYTRTGDFLLRSQIDAFHPSLPDEVFDIKTRAVYPIRMEPHTYRQHQQYTLPYLSGPERSYEREYYDMARSAFLKYTLQAIIGSMDGIFVAYHNTASLLGFQYITLRELAHTSLGVSLPVAAALFQLSLRTLSAALSAALDAAPASLLAGEGDRVEAVFWHHHHQLRLTLFDPQTAEQAAAAEHAATAAPAPAVAAPLHALTKDTWRQTFAIEVTPTVHGVDPASIRVEPLQTQSTLDARYPFPPVLSQLDTMDWKVRLVVTPVAA